tara:strand:+ start:257 stop:412 length:156 start_codon:yes stop_codon:yes gene_type:complete
MKKELTIISDNLNHSVITETEAQTLLLGLIGATKRFSLTELENVLNKPKQT